MAKAEEMDDPLVAVTGTPGTGKSSACRLISDVLVIDLNILAKDNAELFRFDEERETLEVDPKILENLIPKRDGILILEGHLAHHLPADIVIVLRCSPKVLAERLSSRGWSKAKIRENQEAEAIDLILVEALEMNDQVFEIDTTDLSQDEVAGAITEIIMGERGKYAPGNIDWSEEVLDWY